MTNGMAIEVEIGMMYIRRLAHLRNKFSLVNVLALFT